jgi:hypothetical protein
VAEVEKVGIKRLTKNQLLSLELDSFFNITANVMPLGDVA